MRSAQAGRSRTAARLRLRLMSGLAMRCENAGFDRVQIPEVVIPQRNRSRAGPGTTSSVLGVARRGAGRQSGSMDEGSTLSERLTGAALDRLAHRCVIVTTRFWSPYHEDSTTRLRSHPLPIISGFVQLDDPVILGLGPRRTECFAHLGVLCSRPILSNPG